MLRRFVKQQHLPATAAPALRCLSKGVININNINSTINRSVALSTSTASYRLIEHVKSEIEECDESYGVGRWWMHNALDRTKAATPGENMCETLNLRERRRSGAAPQKAQVRDLISIQHKDGDIYEPNTKTKQITVTIIGFDGHPYHIRTRPLPECTLNMLIDMSGICLGYLNYWTLCVHLDAHDHFHGEGCIVAVDLDTLSKLPPPGKWEYDYMKKHRQLNRPDHKFNARCSCCMRLTENMDGAVFALRQYWSRGLREDVVCWGEDDNYSTFALYKQRTVEPWRPMLEEPTVRDFIITPDLLYAMDYESVMRYKYPSYKRKDGFKHKEPRWGTFYTGKRPSTVVEDIK